MPPRPKTVLVVEDDVDVATMLVSVLEDQGYRAIAAHTGSAAVELARREKPDLISLDLLLPGISGQDALHLLKESEETRTIPVVAVSAFLEVLSPGDRSSLVALVPKPLETEEFLMAVERTIGRPARWPPTTKST